MLREIFKACDEMIKSCDIDYNELQSKHIDSSFFEDYNNTRIVNIFLFNFLKLQDKIGVKLFREVLYELREIDKKNLAMIDILNLLEKLEILENIRDWDRLREIRNFLSHEYPFDIDERVENIKMALDSYSILKKIYQNLTNFYYSKSVNI